jgi:archaellum component FlaG (FlaF/FlaG flagellin family)
LDYWDGRLVESLVVYLKMTGKDRLRLDKKLTEVFVDFFVRFSNNSLFGQVYDIIY